MITSASPTQSIEVDLTGRNSLALEVTDAGDGATNDHADWAGARMVVPPLPPSTPTMFAAATTPNQIALSWYASPGASSYHLKRSVTRGGPYQIIASPGTPGSVDSTVAPNTVYYYVVSAVNHLGESTNSAQLAVSRPAYWVRTTTNAAQNWDENGNWTNSSAFPNGIGRAAAVNADIPADQTVRLNRSVTVGSLTIGDTNGSGAYAIVAGGGTITFDNGPSAAWLTQLATSRGDNLAAPISVTSNLIVCNYSSKPLTLSGTNAVFGTVTVAQGSLKAGSTSALGTGTGIATIACGAALDLNGFNLGPLPLTISGTGVNQAGAIVNIAGAQPGTVRTMTLSGDSTFGGTGPWDLRGSAPAPSRSAEHGRQSLQPNQSGLKSDLTRNCQR